MAQRELATRSAYSRRSRSEILSSPVALDLQSLYSKEKNFWTVSDFEFESMVGLLNIIQVRRGVSILLDGIDKFQSNTRQMIIKNRWKFQRIANATFSK